MKKLLSVIMAIALTGCSTYSWVAPEGKNSQEISLDQQSCQDSSYKKYPKDIRTEMIEPSRMIPAHQSCRNIRKKEPYNCKTVNNKMICGMREVTERDCRFVPSQFIEPIYQTTVS